MRKQSSQQLTPIQVFIHHDEVSGLNTKWQPVQLAGQCLLVPHPLELLQPFALNDSGIVVDRQEPILSAHHPVPTKIRTAQGSIDGKWHAVEVAAMEGSYWTRIERIGSFISDTKRRMIVWLDPSTEVTSDQLAQCILGAPFALLAAQQDTWMLHASAAIYQGELVAFVGKSGRGKSTLAAFLDQQPGWSRVADDMLPISRRDGGVDALPRFPQLKLSNANQPSLAHPERLPLHAIYHLEASGKAENTISIEPIAPARAATIIVGQTAIAKLFDKSLMTAHLDFVHHLASTIPARALEYPRQLDCLPSVAGMLEHDLVSV